MTSLIGNLYNFGTVWLNPSSLANILLLAQVRKIRCVTIDMDIEPAMNVHRLDNSVMKFKDYKSGLYYHDADGLNTTNEGNHTFLITVSENRTMFTKRQIENADKPKALFWKIG